LSVVVPTFRRSALLVRCVRSVLGAIPSDAELVISDDGSGDDTESVARGLAADDARIHFITGVNTGPAGARNRGWRAARAPIILFIDDDCTAAPGWGEAFLAAFAASPELAAVEGVTEPEHEIPGYFFHSMQSGRGSYLTCNLAVRALALRAVGGLDERFPYPHGEDLDLCYRIAEEVGEIGFEPRARVLHMVVPISPSWYLRRAKLDASTYRLFALHPLRFLAPAKRVKLPLVPHVDAEHPPRFWQVFAYITLSKAATAYFAARDGKSLKERALGFATHALATALSVTQLGRGWRAYRAALSERASDLR